MSISNWLKMDLHIHSVFSNKSKRNDYKGPDYNAKQLITNLKEEGINLFSITDHNGINKKLYKELLEMQKELVEDNMNFLIGVELDIIDNEIYQNNMFHCLLFFETYDLNKIDLILQDLTLKDQQLKEPSISDVFKILNKHEERDFILIPHFNRKKRALKSKNMEIDARDCLNMMVFDAYEDINNINKIQKSLKHYLDEESYEDFPLLIFSDCHDIRVYPKKDKDDNKSPRFLNILGNIEYPFESLKLGFQDAKLRIGSDNIPENQMFRSKKGIKDKMYHIDSIKLNNTTIELSEYQNTIIGGFGSGKSFLLKMIIYGQDYLKQNYKKEYGLLLEDIEEFKIIMSDGSSRLSLTEVFEDCNVIIFEQNEGVYYKNIIDEEEKKKLEKKLKLEFPKLDKIYKNISESSNINKIIAELKNLKEKQITDEFHYDFLNSRNFYKVDKDTKDLQIEFNIPLKLIEELSMEKNYKVFNKPLYTEDEINKINDVMKIILEKNFIWVENSINYNTFLKNLENITQDYNDHEISAKEGMNINEKIFDEIKEHISNYVDILLRLKKESKNLENILSEEKYNENLKSQRIKEYGDYKLITKYLITKEYENYKKNLLKDKYRKNNLSVGILSTIIDNGEFPNNREFMYNLEKYYEDIFNNNFVNFEYDIQYKNESIMKKSPGEKANMILELIFSITDMNINNNKKTILLIDQPEDHLDNKNIDKNIVNKIIDMKIKNTLPQIIFVTHNANVAITADTENIIIADKSYNTCNYYNSGLENRIFVKDVCEILEGGKDALKRRGMKFSVSYIKEY